MQIETKNESAIYRILSHVNFNRDDVIAWDDLFELVANKLDEYKKQIEEKDAIIKRMIESEK